MTAPYFVDFHSHVIPSGDDGAATIAEGRALCREAARRGTAVLYGTPHVWPELPLTAGREVAVRAAFEALRPTAGLELRLGFELTPVPRLLDEDPRRYVLEGTTAVLVEVPFAGSVDLLFRLGEHVESAGLQPVIAHPERTEAARGDATLAPALAERGWLLQVNGSSLLGHHGRFPWTLAWELVEDGQASIVASDGHRTARPPHLDEAFAAVSRRLPAPRARALFDGSALGLAPDPASGTAATAEPLQRRAATRGS